MTLASIGLTCSSAVAAALVIACGGEPPAEPAHSLPAAEVEAAPAAVTAPAPAAQPEPPAQPEPAAQPEPGTPAATGAAAPPSNPAAAEAPAAAGDPAPAAAPGEETTAPFRRRKMDDFWIEHGGSRIGLPNDARAAFESGPVSRWGDALLEAMEGCYQPEREQKPSLLGSAWSTLTLRGQGKSELQMNVVPPPLARVIACVRKRVPAPPAMPDASGPTSFAIRLSFQGPGRRDPRLR